MADPVISGFISALFSEVCPTLMPVPGVDTPSYCAKLIERFSECTSLYTDTLLPLFALL
jgi:mannitol-1-phosphate/altronate dehydrogenase